MRGESGVGGCGERTEGITVRILYWVITQTARDVILRQSNSLQVASAWGEAVAPPTGITLSHPVILKPSCWAIQVEDTHSLILTESLQAEEDVWELWEFSYPLPGLVLVKASFGVQLASFCSQTSPAEGTTSSGSLIATDRLSRASHKQGLTWDFTRVLRIYLIHRNKEAATMERQRNRPQMKEQETSPEEELDEIEQVIFHMESLE